MQVFSMLLHCVERLCCYVFVIVANKKNEVHRGALRYPYSCFGEDYFFSQQAFSHSAALGQTFSQESAFSQVAQSMWQESAAQHVSALQQESTTQHVSACSHTTSLHFFLLLQHELMVRAATATITNNTFFIFFSFVLLFDNQFKIGAKLQIFSHTLLQNANYFGKNA